MRQHALDEGLVDHAARGFIAVAVERAAGARAHEIVDQRIAWPGIAGNRIVTIHPGYIGDAADIEHRDRVRSLEIARQRLMEDRHQRRALPALRDIGGAEIVGDRNAQPPRQRRAVADLHGQARRRPVQHGLAMKADNGDVGLGDVFGVEKCLDRLGMDAGDKILGLRQHAGPFMTVGQVYTLGQRLPQQPPFIVRIRPVADRAEAGDPLAVGLDQRHVDAVERGPAHQTNCPDYPQNAALSLAGPAC